KADAFLQITQNRAVAGVLPLLDQVADNIGTTAIGQIDFIARVSCLIGEPVEVDVVLRSARFQEMADFGPVRPIEPKRQRAGVPDVKIVRLPGAESVMIELAELN